MRKNCIVVGMIVFVSTFWGTPAFAGSTISLEALPLETTTFPTDQAGISAYLSVDI